MKKLEFSEKNIQNKIYTIRGVQVMLDEDLIAGLKTFPMILLYKTKKTCTVPFI